MVCNKVYEVKSLFVVEGRVVGWFCYSMQKRIRNGYMRPPIAPYRAIVVLALMVNSFLVLKMH